ncbi:MAG TPA: hypothetical protein VLG40_03935 [Candidatus Saccharimonas sp.]|nr:hypothetical protein [Candidatus Saccharimonas sp.]
MKRLVSRLVPHTQTSRTFSTALFLYSLPVHVRNKVDAIAVLPGQGEEFRVIRVAQAFEQHPTARHFFITGSNPIERTWRDYNNHAVLTAPPFNLSSMTGVIPQPTAEHTKEQMDWLVNLIEPFGITSLALYVTNYHCYRAFCTLLAAFRRNKVEWIPIIPVPLWAPPNGIVPEENFSFWAAAAGEAARIFKYRKMGDVATNKELREYLEWLSNHPIMSED